jgi:hypothetical protein
VYEEQAKIAAAKAGLLIGEADKSYLPADLPPDMAATFAVLDVKVLVIARAPEIIEQWIR